VTRKAHSNFTPGKRLLVILRTGERFIDKFEDRSDRWLVFAEHGKVSMRDIRAVQFPK
jgi:hypothetical protein